MQARRSIGAVLLALGAGIAAYGLAVSASSVPAPASSPEAGRSSAAVLQAPAADVATAIWVQIDERVSQPGSLARELDALYQPGDYAPLWLDGTDRSARNVRAGLMQLRRAADDGLDPAEYLQGGLDRLNQLLDARSPLPSRELARFDVALSASTLRYFRHLHTGRVDARTIGFRLKVAADRHDYAALLRSALADQQLAETAVMLRPRLAEYRLLTGMLTRYRSLAAAGTTEAVPTVPAVVRPGQEYEGTGRLFRLLSALDDLPAGTAASEGSGRFEGTLVEGIKRFQERHGLEPDGILGRSTLAALRIPLTWRVRQIELAIERLRWLPHLGEQRLVVINIPMFRLWAWDSSPPSQVPSLGMDVIVGRALGTQTPVFVAEMREVIFRPFWNIPPSILRHEILPALDRDPDYLHRHDMEIVRGPGDDAQPVEVVEEHVLALREGKLRVRQRPGPGNALGLVKFAFPNEANVYMHGTPAQELFARTRRDFSHGCVRVENPVALAEWALKDVPVWNRDRILGAMAGSQSVHVKLARPIQVILFYTTAAVMPDGTIHFADDIYHHDARLDQALAKGRFD